MYNLLFSVFTLCFFSSVSVNLASTYETTDKIRLNCGSLVDVIDTYGHKWSSFATKTTYSFPSIATTNNHSIPEVPYLTAQIFRSDFSYSFPMISGYKRLRLYFYPSSYNGMKASDAVFNVVSGSYNLLENFSASQTAKALDHGFFSKEYIVNVHGKLLNISFTPCSDIPNAYAFVNGIEIVSMPHLDVNAFSKGEIVVVDNGTALEKVHQLNSNINDISPSHDKSLFRSCSKEMQHIANPVNPNTTTKSPPSMLSYVYATSRAMVPTPNTNLSWIFTVNSGFKYLIRLHYCKLSANLTSISLSVSQLILNGQTLHKRADLLAQKRVKGKNVTPVYIDYVMAIQGEGLPQNLQFTLLQNVDPNSSNDKVFLSGVEVFKFGYVNRTHARHNLTAVVRDATTTLPVESTSDDNIWGKRTGAIAFGVVSAVAILWGVYRCVQYCRHSSIAPQPHEQAVNPGPTESTDSEVYLEQGRGSEAGNKLSGERQLSSASNPSVNTTETSMPSRDPTRNQPLTQQTLSSGTTSMSCDRIMKLTTRVRSSTQQPGSSGFVGVKNISKTFKHRKNSGVSDDPSNRETLPAGCAPTSQHGKDSGVHRSPSNREIGCPSNQDTLFADSPPTNDTEGPSNSSHRFNYDTLKVATNNYDEASAIGGGGFGKVYRGKIEGQQTEVAIKRWNGKQYCKQGVVEFESEIERLSKVRHCNIIPLLGYCKENKEMLLVYPYMSCGSLSDHLYKTVEKKTEPLQWKRRLKICLGAARGLQYLHNGAYEHIIHRDIKTDNILLDENLAPKISDFGLCKRGPVIDDSNANTTHVDTDNIKGTFGYLDPEYACSGRLTEKSDVYAFGVVLLEVLSARCPRKQVSLSHLYLVASARSLYKGKGTLDEIIDPFLKAEIKPQSQKKFTDIAMNCIAEHSADRPSMDVVVGRLAEALKLQRTEGAENGNS